MDHAASELPRACRLVADAAARLGLAIDIRLMEQSTRTAEEAAAACRATVGQIVKSLVFAGATSKRPVLLLVSGANRVDEKRVAATIGDRIVRPDAEFVRRVTGFAIGGIPPFGHAEPLATWMDEDLMRHDTVYAAAGAPNAIFAVAPAELQRATGAKPITVRS
ncbi:MAG: cys-tRNA(pro)/cys-tRNA(cys) deacylase [Alphaproteobacteria bacterium]|nr:MAG: cys-tRNA(pro)/cys-tRNA(cys) deacylase [Alphaproteobacteria bacterium]